MENDYTARQEMTVLGIESKHFKTFYDRLRKTQQLPSEEIIPRSQYKTIIDYLKTNNVIGKDGSILVDGLKSFDNRVESEQGQEVHSFITRLKENQDGRHRFFNKGWRKF